jgi:hypothetical protein
MDMPAGRDPLDLRTQGRRNTHTKKKRKSRKENTLGRVSAIAMTFDHV